MERNEAEGQKDFQIKRLHSTKKRLSIIKAENEEQERQAAEVRAPHVLYDALFFSEWRKIWIRDVFWSQHLGCWGQNTPRIQNKEVYATLRLQDAAYAAQLAQQQGEFQLLPLRPRTTPCPEEKSILGNLWSFTVG